MVSPATGRCSAHAYQTLLYQVHLLYPVSWLWRTKWEREKCAELMTFLCESFWAKKSTIYRVIEEEPAILWEMIVCVILSKKVRMNMGPILNGYRDMVKRTFPRLNPLRFLFMGMAEGGGVPHQSGYTCWPCSSHQQCLCLYKGPPSWATACNSQYPATRSQVLWGWWRHLWTFVMRCGRRRQARVLSIADHQ